MPQRIGTPRIEAPRVLRPVAAPVDTYVAPERNSDIEQLANGLSELVPSLSRFAGVLGEQKGAREKQAGEAAARDMAAQGKSFAEAVRSGAIRPDQNPWFRVGFYETAGRNAGSTYVGDFLEALNKSAVKDSVELKDFDEFERTFREQWTTGRIGEDADPFLANAFGTTADGQITGLRNAFAQQAGARMGKLNAEAFHSEIFNTVEGFQRTDLSTSERAAAIRLAQDRQVATGGMTYDQVNRMTASAIGSAAVRLRDTTVLDMLDQIPTDMRSRGYLGGTSYGAELREQSEIAISRAIDDDARREETLRKRRVSDSVRTISGGIVDTLTQDPGADISTYIAEMRKVDPTEIPALFAMRDVIAGGVYSDSPEVVRGLSIGIHTTEPGRTGYTTMTDLNRAFANKDLTLSTYRTLVGDLEKRDEAGGTGKFLRNPILTDIETETRRVFVSEYPDGLTNPAVRENAQIAADEATYQMLTWLQQNEQASPQDILAQKVAIRTRVIRARVGLQADLEKNSSGTQPGVSAGIKPAQYFLTDQMLVGRLERELNDRLTGRTNGFSADLLQTLRLNSIDPTKLGDVQKFLDGNREWLASPSPKP